MLLSAILLKYAKQAHMRPPEPRHSGLQPFGYRQRPHAPSGNFGSAYKLLGAMCSLLGSCLLVPHQPSYASRRPCPRRPTGKFTFTTGAAEGKGRVGCVGRHGGEVPIPSPSPDWIGHWRGRRSAAWVISIALPRRFCQAAASGHCGAGASLPPSCSSRFRLRV